jgi:hypothetical protein
LVIDVVPLSISNRRDTEEIKDFVNQSFWLFLNFRDDRNKSSTLCGSIIFSTTEGSWLIMINVKTSEGRYTLKLCETILHNFCSSWIREIEEYNFSSK